MIACPFCNWGETDNEINLARHFEKEHEYKAFLMLARILLKKVEPSDLIPVSVIDTLIKDFKARQKYDPLEDPIRKYLAYVVIPMLEGLKHE